MHEVTLGKKKFIKVGKGKLWIDPENEKDIRASLQYSGIARQNIDVERKRFPKGILKKTERKIHKKFIVRPHLYTYKPKKGKTFRRKTGLDDYDTAWLGYNTMEHEKGKPVGGYVCIPKAVTKNKTVRNRLIYHELKENLMMQHASKKKKYHTTNPKYDKNIHKLVSRVHTKSVLSDKRFGIGSEKHHEKIMKMFNVKENWK